MMQRLVGACLLLSAAGSSPVGAQHAWPRPVIVPLPVAVEGVARPVVSLDGTWKFTLTPPDGFWRNAVDPQSWHDVHVPDELWMQGMRIRQDVEYPYKRAVEVPADFRGQRVLLRFDGVYSRARVWVNGREAGEHRGGFTSWNLDITEYVTPGTTAWLTVGVTDLSDDPSFASGYARRYYTEDTERLIGGILRSVTLLAVPPDHVTRLHVATDLDDAYRDAVLAVSAAVAFREARQAELRLALTGPDGAAVPLEPDVMRLTRGETERTLEIPVRAPQLWDAEHPNLYRLDAELWVNGRPAQRLSQHVGFREIERIGANLFVNGREVKLRGGNRHSVHPLHGRADVPGIDEQDVLLYKQANINYIRTSHYPTTPRFLEMADRYGLYIEEEMAICWLDHGAAGGALDLVSHNPEYQPLFLGVIAEAIERDRSHPSLIIWSLANESVVWGDNFAAELDYAHTEDPTRPVKIGHNAYTHRDFPELQIDDARQFGLDLDSYHYPGWDWDFRWSFDTHSLPRLFDEYAHVATYNFPTLWRDPNVRNYWGESLKYFWDRMFEANGTLGAAIWGTVDEVFYAPDDVYGYGRWGIVDGWRRPKPEHWLTKKAYSPIAIAEAPLATPGAGRPLRIPVTNRFDHTDLGELRITWAVGQDDGVLQLALPPHRRGVLEIPPREWADGDVVRLTFESTHPSLPLVVDEYALRIGERPSDVVAPRGPAPALAETATEIVVAGAAFRLVFDRATGLLTCAEVEGECVLTGGPYLNLDPYATTDWVLRDLAVSATADAAVLDVAGAYGSVGAEFHLEVSGDGVLTTTYTVHAPPERGTFAEYGVTYHVSPAIDRLDWAREALFSAYPADHIGRPEGTAMKTRAAGASAYRQRPAWDWREDMEDYHLLGRESDGFGMTNDYRSLKEHVYFASAIHAATGRGVRVESDGERHGVRMAQRPDARRIDERAPQVVFRGDWVRDRGYQNYQGSPAYTAYQSTLTHTNRPGAEVELAFEGPLIAWIGPRAPSHGTADVYLDGELVARAADTYGRWREPGQVLFRRDGLPDGPHTLRIVVTGERAHPRATDAAVAVDAFVTAERSEPIYELHVNRYWSYDLGWGNLGGGAWGDRGDAPAVPDGFRDSVQMRLVGGRGNAQ